MSIEMETEMEIEIEIEMEKELSTLIYSSNKEIKLNVLMSTIYINTHHKNTIFIQKNFNDLKTTLFLMYEHKNNNIYVMNTNIFNNFLRYNNVDDIVKRFTIVSLKNKHIYGFVIDNTNYYRIIIKELLSKYKTDNSSVNKFLSQYALSNDDMKFANKDKDKKIVNEFEYQYDIVPREIW